MILAKYRGVIVREGLKDAQIIKQLEVLERKVTREVAPVRRWHLYKVRVTRNEIKMLGKNLASPKWYMHFWQARRVIAVFHDKQFEFDYDDKTSWEPVIEHGLSLGIPQDQLDFKID